MNRILKCVLAVSFAGVLAACTYDEPVIFGVPDHIWSRMSGKQREVVAEKASSASSTSINPKVFSRCLSACKPAPSTNAQGYDQSCFRQCLTKSLKLDYITTPDFQDPAEEWRQ